VPGHLFVCVIRVPVCARASRVSPAYTINFVRNSTKLAEMLRGVQGSTHAVSFASVCAFAR
jgi:hypothetical protein